MEFCNTVRSIEDALCHGLIPVILEERGKKPIEKNYKEKYMTISREGLLKEAIRRNGSNVGVLVENFLCIDVDLQNSGLTNWEEILLENKIEDMDDIDTPIVRTGSRGRHYYFQITPDIAKCKAYLKRGGQKVTGIDVKKSGHMVYPGSVYGGCSSSPHKCGAVQDEFCLFREKKYEWVKNPNEYPISPIPNWLLNYIAVPIKKTTKSSTVEPNLELLQACFEPLRGRANTYIEWRDVIWCIRALGFSVEVAHEFSMLSEKYDQEGVDRIWEEYDSSKANWSWSSIFQWLKEDMNEEEYKKFCDSYVSEFDTPELVLEGDWGLSKLFVSVIKDKLKLVDPKANGYFYNEELRLWKKFYPEYLCHLVSDSLRPVLKDIVENAKRRDSIHQTKLASVYKPVLDRVLTTHGAMSILKQSIEGLEDSSFITKIDRIEYLLPIKHGKVINLKTLEVRDRQASDYFSTECNVEFKPSERYQVAEKFFKSICSAVEKEEKEEEKYVLYLRKLLAYFLTGSISDRKFYIFVGAGMNGKSTLMKIMEKILGNFYKGLSESVIIAQDRSTSCTPELLPLVYCRMGVLPENRENVRLHNDRLKALTGDDSIVCRPLYMEEFNFTTQSKLILMTNELPRFNGADKAMIDRIVVLPFRASFTSNPKYKQTLLDNIDEIFSYIVTAGVQFWQEQTLGDLPEIVEEERRRYVRNNDLIGMFLNDCVDKSPNQSIIASALYSSYKNWSDDNRQPILDSHKFFSSIEKLYTKKRTKRGMIYEGISIKILEEEKEENT
jgi:P4 family phage/plasmid primase-like protien